MKKYIQRLKTILNSNIFIIVLTFFTIFNLIYKLNHVKSKYDINTESITGIVTNIKIDDKKTTITLKAKENIIVYYYKNIDINLGDKIEVIGALNPLSNNTNFNLFNYRNYMLSKNTYYSISADNIYLVSKCKNILYKIKKYLINRINKMKGYNYLNTFILGDSSEINTETYQTNGVSHLFSVSGMHIALLSSLILFILNKLKKSNINYIFVIIFLIFYAFLTNFTPSVIRASLLFIFLFINKVLNLKLPTLKVLIIILCLNLIINPYNIYNTGFKFSYTISIYLVCFNKLINNYKNYFKKTLMISLISFLASIPILINNFFSINIMTILNNIIFVPLVSIIVFPLSLLVLIIKPLDFIYKFIIDLMENISIFMENFKIEIVMCKVNIIIIILYYILITFILIMLYKRKYKYLMLIIALIFIHHNINYIKNNPYVTFIDVKQGDSTLIHLPYNNGDILIDTGGLINYDTSSDIINYLKSEGIKDIDYLILTHGDFDHSGSSINLVNNFKVNKVILNNDEFNDLEKELINTLNNKNIKYYNNIEKINIGKYKFYFLNTKLYNNENDNSNILYTEIDNNKLLFMGDASKEVENNILKKYNIENIDILKVGHHGSNTSTDINFINKISPKISIISVGLNNKYGHPKSEVLDILSDSKVYRTDLNGSIKVKLKDGGFNIKTCIKQGGI